MKFLKIVTILSLTHFPLYSQNIAVTYFNQNWDEVKTKEGATYYRTVEPVKDKFLVKDLYLKNDNVQMVAECKAYKPTLVFDGKVIWYYEDGTKQKEGAYKENKQMGRLVLYYTNGSLQVELDYEEEGFLVRQYWLETGQPLLSNGTGFIVDTTHITSPVLNDTPISSYTEVIDYKVVNSFFVRRDKSDSIYTKAEIPAEYTGGLEGFYKDVSNNLVYPKSARRQGVEGKIFIQFITDKTGQLTEPTILRGIGTDCDEAALTAIKSTGKWRPSQSKGMPVKSIMVLPITFKLSGLFQKK